MIARSIVEMRDAASSMFYGQSWYDDEPFAHLKLVPPIGLPTHLQRCTLENAPPPDERTDAVLLVALYLQYPRDAMFHHELLCADVTRRGESVYVGNTTNGKGLEIHRILKPVQFSVPLWR